MRNILLIIAFLISYQQYGQTVKYIYHDFDMYECISIEQDSFMYEFSCGLMFGKIHGTVEELNDTLIFNSELQPFYEINKSFVKKENDDLLIKICNSTYQLEDLDFILHHSIGFRLYNKKGDYEDLNMIDSTSVDVVYDEKNDVMSYSFSKDIVSRKQQLHFIVYRTNLEFKLDFTPSEVNQIEIIFNDLSDITDYHFFTNQKIILTEEGLVFLIDGEPEETVYSYVTNNKLKISRKTIVKEYKRY